MHVFTPRPCFLRVGPHPSAHPPFDAPSLPPPSSPSVDAHASAPPSPAHPPHPPLIPINIILLRDSLDLPPQRIRLFN